MGVLEDLCLPGLVRIPSSHPDTVFEPDASVVLTLGQELRVRPRITGTREERNRHYNSYHYG